MVDSRCGRSMIRREMTTITSRDNQIYKLVQKLETKKYRDKTGLYLIEGENLVAEAAGHRADMETILIRDGYSGPLPGGTARNILTVDRGLFDKLADTRTSQGIMAIVRKPVFSSEEFIRKGAPGNFVVLDRLQDPGNIGTIIRTADAAGYSLVMAMKGTADVFSPKVVRAAAGSLFRVPVAFVDSEEELLRFTRAAGKKLTATCLDGGLTYYEADLSRDIALVIGNEGGGVSRSLMENAQQKVSIPMKGTIESLNASVAAALIMYEAVRAESA